MWPRVDGLRALELGAPGALRDEQTPVAVVGVTAVDVLRFADVPWQFATAEAEGEADLDAWRDGHRRYWAVAGTPVEDETPVVCLRFRLV